MSEKKAEFGAFLSQMLGAALCLLAGCGDTVIGPLTMHDGDPMDGPDGGVSIDAAVVVRDAAAVFDASRDAVVTASSDASRDGSVVPPSYEVVETTRTSGLLYERIRYLSGALRIYGLIVRPDDALVHPAVIYNHGGGAGIQSTDLPVITTMAGVGVAVFASSYRGEDGSDGAIETCLGEVDDVLALTNLAAAHASVDPTHMSMIGGSHGGCITTRAFQRGAAVQSAVALFPATDATRLYDFYNEQYALAVERHDSFHAADYAARRDGFVTTCGGTPHEQPDCYAARSATAHLDELSARTDADLLVIHGMRDTLIHYSDSCDFAARAGSFESYRVSSTGAILTESPAGCEGVSFRTGPLPRPEWTAHRIFVLMDALEHGTNLEASGGLGLMYEYLGSRLF